MVAARLSVVTRAAPFLIVVVSISFASPVWAANWGTLSGSLAVTSDYRFRGVSQSDLRPAPQAELDWNAPGQWTLSVWVSRIDFRDHQNTSIELDMSADKRFDLAGTDIDIEALYHAYPNHHLVAGGIRYSAIEAITTISHRWGRFTASTAVAWSPDNVGQTGIGWDIESQARFALCKWLSVSGTVGRQWVHEWNVRPDAGYPYEYWDAGFTARRGKFAFDLRYAGTSLNGRQCLLTFGGTHWCQSGVVTSLSYAIGAGE